MRSRLQLHPTPAPGAPATEPAPELGICDACHLQPCQCANRKEPGWIERLAREVAQLTGRETIELGADHSVTCGCPACLAELESSRRVK